MATEIATTFLLQGIGFDPDDITILLGIQPTKVWRYGAPIPKTTMHYKNDSWLLSTDYEVLDEEHLSDLTRQVDSLINRLQPSTAKLKEICARFRLDVKLYCVLYIEDADRPAIQFSPAIVEWLAELHAGIDVVTYFLSDSAEKPPAGLPRVHK